MKDLFELRVETKFEVCDPRRFLRYLCSKAESLKKSFFFLFRSLIQYLLRAKRARIEQFLLLSGKQRNEVGPARHSVKVVCDTVELHWLLGRFSGILMNTHWIFCILIGCYFSMAWYETNFSCLIEKYKLSHNYCFNYSSWRWLYSLRVCSEFCKIMFDNSFLRWIKKWLRLWQKLRFKMIEKSIISITDKQRDECILFVLTPSPEKERKKR